MLEIPQIGFNGVFLFNETTGKKTVPCNPLEKIFSTFKTCLHQFETEKLGLEAGFYNTIQIVPTDQSLSKTLPDKLCRQIFNLPLENTLKELLIKFLNQLENPNINASKISKKRKLTHGDFGSSGKIPKTEGSINCSEGVFINKTPFEREKNETVWLKIKSEKIESEKIKSSEKVEEALSTVDKVLVKLCEFDSKLVLKFAQACLGFSNKVAQEVIKKAFLLLIREDGASALELAKACVSYVDEACQGVVKNAFSALSEIDIDFGFQFAKFCLDQRTPICDTIAEKAFFIYLKKSEKQALRFAKECVGMSDQICQKIVLAAYQKFSKDHLKSAKELFKACKGYKDPASLEVICLHQNI